MNFVIENQPPKFIIQDLANGKHPVLINDGAIDHMDGYGLVTPSPSPVVGCRQVRIGYQESILVGDKGHPIIVFI